MSKHNQNGAVKLELQQYFKFILVEQVFLISSFQMK